MEDDYDIYGDLEGFEEEAAQDNKVVHELNAQIAELRERIAEKEHEKQDTIARNTILLENISSLLVTAKAELKRKDAVIADIRRDRDNAAFRRKRNVQRHDQGTQTTLVRLLSREVQTEGEAPSRVVKREREAEWKWERKRVEEDQRRREEERLKVKERVPVRERLGGRVVMSHQNRKRGRGRNREEERERERQARRGPRSPEVERHPVRFRSPVRVKAEESSVPDSASDIELSRAFIPMNRKELDRYVKEIGREQNRSPVVVEVTKREKIGKPLKDVKGEELWDTRPRKKTKTPKKHRKLVGKTPVKRKSPGIIQSDEIGTTACGSSSLSPVKSEDIEQRMSALHGHPPLPEPPEVVIPPPPEPPIIEDVPVLPLEDDAKLNDSRELKIVESSDEQVVQSEPATVEDEQNSSAETVIERSRVEDDVDLEDGEVITPAPSPAPPSKEEIAEAKRIAKIAQAVAQLAQETKIKLEQKETDSPLKTKVKQVKLKRKRADRSPKVEPNPEELPVEVAPPPPKEPTPEQDQQTKHKRNLNGAFELPDQPTTQRRNTFSGALVNDKAKRKPRLSEPGSSKVAATKKTEALHELFGTDDENSFVVAPPPEEEVSAHGKRKRTESAGEVVEGKKSRKVVEDATKEEKSAGTDKSEEVAKKEVVDESVVEDEGKIIPKDKCGLDSREEQEENEALTQNTTEPDEDIETLKSDSATSVESASTAQSDQQELASGSEPAFNGFDDPKGEADEPTVNVPKKEEIDDPKHEEAAAAANADEDDKPNHPPETIVVSNKYCEYRIEDDNEVETTFYVTRKKKRKTKSKSRNASLNASGAN
ncbi:zinc finger CCCH domain-containing protein 13-like [Culex pipiens pallens]|uniref:zinc finger CCCH domain-containing protein 13-like n=1 Tax=Culex pipiens pallens TaxID=42434 RepID=UPI001953F3B1|nr:zinc finger CCCH domain-containing protein 13-like [Culex pipiens pallens]